MLGKGNGLNLVPIRVGGHDDVFPIAMMGAVWPDSYRTAWPLETVRVKVVVA
jgi:hypothetical protein